MDGARRLNPHAPPFYPSRFNIITQPPSPSTSPYPQQHLAPPPRATTGGTGRSPFTHPLSPVTTGPRNRGGRCSGRRCSAGGRGVAGDGGRSDGNRQSWIRKSIQREIVPLDPDESSTSIMIRNIPNNYTRDLLVELLDHHCKQENEKDENTIKSAFDFVYLPIDFKHRLNAGYAFVNFTSPDAAWRFQKSIKGKGWDLFESKKIADVARAKIQGKDALVRNFERMQLRSPKSEYLPVWFEPPREGVASSSTMKMHAIGKVESW